MINGVIGEEFGYENQENEYVWILDPIDGTHSFIAGKTTIWNSNMLHQRNKPIINA